mmetsp:Transcript_48856/g.110878  ORF Transcript_48856/g.110878 Transcript_48856/m.110878 type:complete len:282 (-) Transcript_48856:19-864(-)
MPRNRRGKSLKASKKRAAEAVKLDDSANETHSENPKAKKRRIEHANGVKLSINEALALQTKAREADRSEAPPNPHKALAAMERTSLRASEKEQYIGLDCEMVGTGEDGQQSVLARACLVDFDGNIVYDAFVKVDQRVTDFRTQYSGVRPSDLKSGKATTFKECVSKVAALVKGKVLVGHALQNDLKVLMLTHPRHAIRDTARYRPMMRYQRGKFRPRKLKELAKENLGLEIQGGEHTPDEDANAAMLLYRLKRNEWESNLKVFKGAKSNGIKPGKPKASNP